MQLDYSGLNRIDVQRYVPFGDSFFDFHHIFRRSYNRDFL